MLMDKCTLVLSEVEEDVWVFVKLEHEEEGKYCRMGDPEENSILDSSFSDQICREFMQHFYRCFYTFYGPIRGWIFRQKLGDLQKLITLFVGRYQEMFRYEGSLDLVAYCLRDIRLIPLDVNSTLKFSYFRNVLQSYDGNVAHIMVFAYGHLAYSSLSKHNTEFFANYLFATGEPYAFTDARRSRLALLPELPTSLLLEKFGVLYNSRVAGLEEGREMERGSVAVSRGGGVDLLGLESRVELFESWLEGEAVPLRVNFYQENNMLFLTFYRENPNLSQLIFQNRFYHDNADKFLVKISESLTGLLKPTDPFRFLFHNAATFSGKSTIREWKSVGAHLREVLEGLQQREEGCIATLTHQNCWLYGFRRLSRLLILIVPSEIPLNKIEDFANKMTREYFTKAYI